jgi:Na+-translocating ferredoxin:NAD+ oxidoreductase RnfA subunit
MSWVEQPIFFVDFEGSRVSGVLEYGVVGLLRGEIVQTNTRLCGATGAIRPEDTAVHGLRAEMLGTRRPFSDEWEFFAGLRERLEAADVPAPFRGAPIALVTAGLMALAFMGFTGMVRT